MFRGTRAFRCHRKPGSTVQPANFTTRQKAAKARKHCTVWKSYVWTPVFKLKDFGTCIVSVQVNPRDLTEDACDAPPFISNR